MRSHSLSVCHGLSIELATKTKGDCMKTDKELKAELQKISILLGLPIEEEVIGACATFKLNKHQNLFIRLMGAGRGKGYASVSPAKKEIYHQTRLELSNSIHFAEGKAVEAIAKDIQRRLLKPEINQKFLDDIIKETVRVDKQKSEQTWLNKELEAMGFYGQTETKKYYNDYGVYIHIGTEDGNPYLDRFTLPSGAENHIRILKAIIKEAQAIEEENK